MSVIYTALVQEKVVNTIQSLKNSTLQLEELFNTLIEHNELLRLTEIHLNKLEDRICKLEK